MALIYQPHPKQVEAHRAFMTDGFNRGVLFWGRQVGKTMWSVYHAWLSAALKQGTYFIVFKTYNQASQVVWKQYLHMIPKELILGKPNADELSITFKHLSGPIAIPGIGWVQMEHNPDLPPSRIRLLGSDQADSHRGNKANGIIFDEYADQNPDNWGAVYQPMFSTTNGWAIFMGTPKGYNHFYDLTEEAMANPQTYFYSKATWRDNPAYSLAAYNEAKADAIRKGTVSTFMQEYELEFRSVQGAVFPEFSRDTHVIKYADLPNLDNMTHYITIDFGYVAGHPTAINFVAIDGEGNWFVYDEINAVEVVLDDIIEMMRLKMGDRRYMAVIADSARADLIAQLQKARMPAIAANKGHISGQSGVTNGLTLMHNKLKPRTQLLGPPRPSFVVTSNCKHTILNFEQYRYPEEKSERLPSEVPVKFNDDHIDGLRYLFLHLKNGVVNQDQGPPPPMKFGDYGMPL